MQLSEPEDGDGYLLYEKIVHRWRISTQIFTGERGCQLAYHHDVWSVDNVQPVILKDRRRETWPMRLKILISLAAWLGVCHLWFGTANLR